MYIYVLSPSDFATLTELHSLSQCLIDAYLSREVMCLSGSSVDEQQPPRPGKSSGRRATLPSRASRYTMPANRSHQHPSAPTSSPRSSRHYPDPATQDHASSEGPLHSPFLHRTTHDTNHRTCRILTVQAHELALTMALASRAQEGPAAFLNRARITLADPERSIQPLHVPDRGCMVFRPRPILWLKRTSVSRWSRAI